jgi:hypothetical protein
VVKISSSGTKQWDRRFGGDSDYHFPGTDFLYSTIQTVDGGFLLGGISNSKAGGDLSESTLGYFDYWVVKISSTGAKQWDKRFGGEYTDILSSVAQTSDGGFLLGGSSVSGISGDRSQSSRGGGDYWVVKINSTGGKLWDKRFGGSSNDDLSSLTTTSDGGFLMAGWSNSGIGGDKTTAVGISGSLWIVKASSSGTKQWDRSFGSDDYENLSVVLRTADGGYLLGGTSASAKGNDKSEVVRGYNDYWIVKISSTGTRQWDRRFGGSKNEELRALVQTSDGGYLLGGTSASGAGGDKSEGSRGGNDYWIIKINSTGAKVWNKRFGGSGDDQLTSLATTSDGGYLLGGTSTSSSGGDKSETGRGGKDFWVVKVNSTGTRVWDKRFGGSGTDELRSLVRASDGGFLLGGFSSSGIGGDKSQGSRGRSDQWVVKISSTGTKQWDRRFGGSAHDQVYSLITTADGGYLLAGFSSSGLNGDKSESSRGSNDYWAVKISSSGAKQWDKRFGGSGNEKANVVIRTLDGGYLLAGWSFSGVGGDKTNESRGSADQWVVKISGSGVKQWDQRFGGSFADDCVSAVQNPDGSYLLAGSTFSEAFMESDDNGEYGLIPDYDVSEESKGGKDYWIVKTTSPAGSPTVAAMTAGAVVEVEGEGLLAYPNPFRQKLSLEFSVEQQEAARLAVYDLNGKLVQQLYQGVVSPGAPYTFEWDGSQVNSGIYFIRLDTESKVKVEKVVLAK